MSEMVERVARALWVADARRAGHSDAEHEPIPLSERAVYEEDARAALEALREPTEGMVEVGAMADVPWEYRDVATGAVVEGPFALEISGPNKIERAKEVVGALHRAMISAALDPPVTPSVGE